MSVAGHFSSLSPAVLPAPSNPARQSHVAGLFTDYEREVFRRTNQFFAWLLGIQWVFAVTFALIWSPQTWAGRDSAIHVHVYAAIFLGALLTLPPIWCMRAMPYELMTRQLVAAAQMGFSALLIDLTGGRIETHFHVFGSLAFLALYRDWRVFPTATLVVALDHLLRGLWLPESVYGVPYATIWRTAEHAGWVIFEDVVLVWACLVSRREMWEICCRHDENATLLEELEERVAARTAELQAEMEGRKRTADELVRSEERYRQFIANVPIGIVETTRAGEVRLVNPHILSLLQLGPSASGKLHLGDGRIFPLEERKRFWEQLEAKGEVRGFETALTRTDGAAVPVVLNARLRAGTKDADAICEGTVEDISERKRAERELQTMHRQVVEASRQAGRADVATGVLHNVGNVLTSVNLIVHDVQDRLRGSRLVHLHRAVEKLKQERHRLAEFLTVDEVGKALPEFLSKLDTHLGSENERLARDIETLVGHFEHIRQIIVVQQSSARLYGVTENIAPAELVEEALRLNAESFQRHGIRLVQTAEEAPRVRVDRHKAMQILVNLLKNAKDSVLSVPGLERSVTVRIASAGPDRVAIAIQDNGVGIPAENLRRIFQHGFTTKKDGHGFGLHSCVLAAREMSGDLTVASEGPGRGAEFRLLLPVAAVAS